MVVKLFLVFLQREKKRRKVRKKLSRICQLGRKSETINILGCLQAPLATFTSPTSHSPNPSLTLHSLALSMCYMYVCLIRKCDLVYKALSYLYIIYRVSRVKSKETHILDIHMSSNRPLRQARMAHCVSD